MRLMIFDVPHTLHFSCELDPRHFERASEGFHIARLAHFGEILVVDSHFACCMKRLYSLWSVPTLKYLVDYFWISALGP